MAILDILMFSIFSFLAFPNPKWECGLFDSYSESKPANQQPRDLNRMEVKNVLILKMCVKLNLLVYFFKKSWKIHVNIIFFSFFVLTLKFRLLTLVLYISIN